MKSSALTHLLQTPPWNKSNRTQVWHSRQFQALSHLRGIPCIPLCPHLECLPTLSSEEPTHVLETNQRFTPHPRKPRLAYELSSELTLAIMIAYWLAA